MTNYIESIYSDFRRNYRNDPDFVINFYKSNSIYLDKINHFKEKQHLKFYIEIISKYADAIYQKGHYNLAIDMINDQQIFIDKEIERLHADELKDSWYHSLQCVKGMSSYYLNDYKTATSIFKNLVEFDNQNDLFKIWLNNSRYGLNLWMVRTINIVCAILIVTEIIFESLIKNFYVRISLLGIGTLGLLSNWTYEYYLKRSFRKKEAK
jgi:hypothetical protein